MEDWIQEELSKYDLKTVEIDFSVHVLKGKNLKPDDLDNAEETIRKGRVVEEKSDRLRKRCGGGERIERGKPFLEGFLTLPPSLHNVTIRNKSPCRPTITV